MIIHTNLEQGSPEWHKIRAGRLTASNAATIAVAGKGLISLCYETLSEKYSSGEHESFTNRDIERGNELEYLARELYELKCGVKVDTVGFISLDERVGCSPDGLVGEDGGIEIKCKKDSAYLRAIVEEEIDKDYLYQVQMCLMITGRKWWDYIDYCPNFEFPLNITRIYPDMTIQEQLKLGIEKGKKIMKEIEEAYQNLLLDKEPQIVVSYPSGRLKEI